MHSSYAQAPWHAAVTDLAQPDTNLSRQSPAGSRACQSSQARSEVAAVIAFMAANNMDAVVLRLAWGMGGRFAKSGQFTPTMNAGEATSVLSPRRNSP